MEFVRITEDNAKDFSGFIDRDNLEELRRNYFRSFGATDEENDPVGAIVYELSNIDSEEATRSRIRLLAGENDEVRDDILDEYEDACQEEKVTESYYETPDEQLSRELAANGFHARTAESPDLMVSLADVKRMIGILKIKRIPGYIKSLSEVSLPQYRSFIKNCIYKGRKGLLEDIAYLPKNRFEQNVSSCLLTDNEMQGALFVRKAASGVMHIELYVAFGPDYKKHLLYLIAYSAQDALKRYPEETKIVIRRHNEHVKNLTKKLFSGACGDQIFCGERKEC